MKTVKRVSLYFLAACLVLGSCKIDRFPETSFSDTDFWNTESDLINAANRLY